MSRSGFVAISVVVANLSGLAISVLMPHALSASEYSIFALCWAAGQLLASVVFDWLRFPLLRFAVGKDEAIADRRRDAIGFSYGLISAALIALAILAVAVAAGATTGPVHDAIYYAGLVMAFAVCQGIFDARQALARAELDNGRFSVAWLVRSVSSLVLSLAGAHLLGGASGALAGLMASFPISLLLVSRTHIIRIRPAPGSLDQISFVFRFGISAAAATNISLLMPALLRAVAVSRLGLEEAAGLLLAIDLSFKAMAVAGLAVNVLAMQSSVRAFEFGSAADFAKQARAHLVQVTAVIVPAAMGFYLVYQPFMAVFIPADLRASFEVSIGWAIAASAVMGIRMFGADSLLFSAGRATSALPGPVVAAVIVIILGFLTRFAFTETPSGLSLVYLAANVIGALITWGVMLQCKMARIDLRDAGAIGLGVALMTGAIHFVPADLGWKTLVLSVIVGMVVYGTTVLVFDVANARSIIRGGRRVAR